jgi:hypothetical protein
MGGMVGSPSLRIAFYPDRQEIRTLKTGKQKAQTRVCASISHGATVGQDNPQM